MKNSKSRWCSRYSYLFGSYLFIVVVKLIGVGMVLNNMNLIIIVLLEIKDKLEIKKFNNFLNTQ